MSCRRCGDSEFVIRTNPKGRCFDYISGIKKKVEEFDTAEAGSLGVIDTDYGNGIMSSSAIGVNIDESDDIAVMEKQNADVRNANRKAAALRESMKFQRDHMMNDHFSNSKLRASFRVERKAKKRRAAVALSLGLGRGIEVSDELPADHLDAKQAFDAAFSVADRKVKQKENYKFGQVRKESIFRKMKKHIKEEFSSRTRIKKEEEIDARREGLTSKRGKYIRIKIEEEIDDKRETLASKGKKRLRISDKDGKVLVKDIEKNEIPSICDSALSLIDYNSDST